MGFSPRRRLYEPEARWDGIRYPLRLGKDIALKEAAGDILND